MKHRIYVVGMGPGQENMMTQEAMQVLEASDVIIGYTVYLRLLLRPQHAHIRYPLPRFGIQTRMR